MNTALGVLHEFGTRLREQALEIAHLRAALDVQFQRIAQMQAELDRLPQARKRRQSLLTQQPSHDGNGRHDRY
jgi:uncharacterized coiled-coil protein SlyX